MMEAKANKIFETELFKEQEEMPENEAYFKRHKEAAVAYMKSLDKKGGITLSERLWKVCEQARDELECAVTLAVGSGQDAKKTAQEIRQYLWNPDAMYRLFAVKNGRKWKKQVTDENGNKKYVDVNIDMMHPGRGVYRDARKNAMRVARTETNRAFRSADCDRWSQADYILGIRIQPSKTTHDKATKGKGDICDKLAGDYPKDFKFTGWHPNCFCYATPIVMSAEEMKTMLEAKRRGEKYVSPNLVTKYPDGFAVVAGEIAARGYHFEWMEKAQREENNSTKGSVEKGASRSATNEAEDIIDEDYLGRADYTKEQTKNMEAVERTLGVERGKPMTFWDADGGESNRNAANDDYRNNCTSCVVANEMRRRGFDVTAGKQVPDIADDTLPLWKKKDGKPVEFVNDKGLKSEDINVLKKTLDRLTKDEGSRWSIGWSGKGISLGHNICLERINGKMVLYDPQVSGRIAFWNLEEVVEKTDKEEGLELLRIDTLLLSEEIVAKCVSAR